MLVLSRKIGQSLLIGQDIRLTVCAISGGQVRIAIQAPKAIKVLREEVACRAQQSEGGLGNGNQGENAQSATEPCVDKVP